MTRARLQRGEASEITLRAKVDGRWVAESKVPASTRPEQWRASARYQDGADVRPREITATASSKSRAATILRARLAATMDQSADLTVNTTVREAVESHLADLEAGKLEKAPATVRTYGSVIRHDVLRDGSSVAGMRIVDVRAADLKAELREILAASGESHLKHVRAIWRTVFQSAVDTRIIGSNPVMSIGSLPKKRTKVGRTYTNGERHDTERVLTPAEQADLWAKVRQDERAKDLGLDDLVLVGLTQGLRISEAVSLRWEDLDLEAAMPTLSVRGKLQRVKGQGLVWDEVTKSIRGRRTIPLLSQEIVLMLRRRRDERDEMERHADPKVQEIRDRFIFLSETGRHMDGDNTNKQLRDLFDRCGYSWATYHSLRRTKSADLKRAGIPGSEVARFLGHSERVNQSSYADGSSVPLGVLAAVDPAVLPAPATKALPAA